MSEQTTLFKLPYNRFLMQRMEFVVMCGDHLAANILRVIESEIIKRKDAWEKRAEKAIEEKKPLPKKPKIWWARLSQSQIIARLYMYDSAKLKKPESEDLNSPEWVEYRFKKALSISKATLKKAIELLKNLGFLIEKSQEGDEFGAPIYTLNQKNIQEAMNKLPADPFTIFYHLGGVENFESGGDSKNFNVPPQNFESGESQKNEVPPEEFSPGESQNFQVDIDSSIDSPEDSEIDSEEEGTSSEHDHADTGTIAPTPALSQDRDATYEEAWEAYKRIELNYARTNQMLAKGETPALSHDSYSHDTPTHEEDTDGHSHTDMAFHGGTLPARSNTHSQLASAANSAAREVAHGHRAPTFAQHGRTDPAQTSQQQATAERVAPPDSNGYENTDEDTVSVPAQQLSTSVPQSGKVSHARTEGRKKKAEAPEPITLSPEARAIWRAWCSLFTVEVELIPSNAAAAEKLVKPARAWCGKLHWTLAEWLKAIKDNAYEADNKGYYSKRGVKLFDIPRELEGWQSAKEHEIDQAKRPQTNTSAGTFSGLPRWTPVYPQA